MNRYLLCLSLLFCNFHSFSQTNGSGKIGASLKAFLADKIKEERFIIRSGTQVLVPVLVEATEAAGMAELEKAGIRFRTIAGNVATADIALQDIEKVAGLPSVNRIELPLLFRKTDTTLLRMTRAGKVLRGEIPLPAAYTGKNVLLGIIDDGVDITHSDFLDTSGKTRLTALWNMNGTGVPPAAYSYGRMLLPDSINYFISQYRKPTTTNTEAYALQNICGYAAHGSAVAGLAAGNSGVAPGATIAAVGLTAFSDTLLRSDRVIDAIAFIYSVAVAKEKKCVINISLGLMDGAPHDGKSLVEKAIDAFCSTRPNLLVCVSAGNYGNTMKHWGGFPIRPDSSFGIFSCAYRASIYFSIPKAYSATLRISLTEAKKGKSYPGNIGRDSIYYQTPFISIDSLIRRATPVTFTSYLKNNILSGFITFSAAHYNNDYDELIITADEQTSTSTVLDEHLYRYVFKGQGYVHGWYPFANLHPVILYPNQYPSSTDSTFHISDNDYTTIIPTHAFTVLSSGAYNIRNCYVDTFGKVYTAYPSCQLTYFTSHGPTLDGRIKPDVLSPGENVLAPRSRTYTYFGYGNEVGKDWEYFGGTSASSPITAGIAALLWQRFPGLTRDSIIARLKATTYTDSYTAVNGALPNDLVGWGKLDAFKALTGISTTDSSLCNPVNCIGKPITPTNSTTSSQAYSIRLYPNPASSFVNLSYTAADVLSQHLYNTVGQRVMTLVLPAANTPQLKTIRLSHLSAGMYFIRAGNERYRFSQKLLIVR